MVNVGELEITGTLEDTGIDQGFNRIQQNFKDTDVLAKQSNATLAVVAKTTKRLGLALVGIGAAGLASMTSLATKSPVLAGTMAKIELQTLKLSNTIGRQLKPIFETIAGELLPALNQAFLDNAASMDIIVGKTSKLIEILADLIKLDFKELTNDLDDLFAPKGLPAETPEQVAAGGRDVVDPFAETKQRVSNLTDFELSPGFPQNLVPLNFRMGLEGGKVGVSAIIDFFQWFSNYKESKEMNMSMADGVPR